MFDLYSSDYVDQDHGESPPSEDSSAVRFSDLKAYLRKQSGMQGKVFLDYGCGANPISFKLARENGLTPLGMELSADVRKLATLNTGVKLLSREDIREGNELFDVIFLGDVLEHLVDPISELKFLRTKLADGGTLLAQGPLQGASTLTHLVVRLFAWTTRGKLSSYPPYHVSLASSLSMKRMLIASGFQLTYLKTFEVDWPAPSLAEVRRHPTFRNLTLFLTKKIDKILATILPHYGTRYFLSCSSNASL
ncbi:MAG: class I SAM-dependent methyltransferase [Candidatus Nanopelagicaceae bacterium]|nr:class I SAM-dependent methyltransferase [Candidatus Nanopelagicaceae bacterium]